MAVVFFATPIKSFHQFSSMSHFDCDRLGEGKGAVLQNSGKHKSDFQTRPLAPGMSEFQGGGTQEKSGMRINKKNLLLLSCGHTIFTKKLHGCLPPPI